MEKTPLRIDINKSAYWKKIRKNMFHKLIHFAICIFLFANNFIISGIIALLLLAFIILANLKGHLRRNKYEKAASTYDMYTFHEVAKKTGIRIKYVEFDISNLIQFEQLNNPDEIIQFCLQNIDQITDPYPFRKIPKVVDAMYDSKQSDE